MMGPLVDPRAEASIPGVLQILRGPYYQPVGAERAALIVAHPTPYEADLQILLQDTTPGATHAASWVILRGSTRPTVTAGQVHQIDTPGGLIAGWAPVGTMTMTGVGKGRANAPLQGHMAAVLLRSEPTDYEARRLAAALTRLIQPT